MAKQQYPSYTQPRNPFGSLTHSTYVPTYVGLPIDRMKETADILQDKYNTAISNINTTETMLAQMDLSEEDEKNRKLATDGFKKAYEPFKLAGNYEDANTVISNSARDIATNSGLIASLKSKKQKDLQLAGFKALLAQGKIKEEDIKFREAEANAIYKEQGGVYFDEATGAWKGLWDMQHIPDVLNIGDKAIVFARPEAMSFV